MWRIIKKQYSPDIALSPTGLRSFFSLAQCANFHVGLDVFHGGSQSAPGTAERTIRCIVVYFPPIWLWILLDTVFWNICFLHNLTGDCCRVRLARTYFARCCFWFFFFCCIKHVGISFEIRINSWSKESQKSFFFFKYHFQLKFWGLYYLICTHTIYSYIIFLSTCWFIIKFSGS